MAVKRHIGNKDKGVFIFEDTVNSLVEKNYIRFQSNDISIYIDKFADLVGEGIFLENSCFENHIWTAYGNSRYVTFNFTSLEYNQDLYLPLKCFVILQLFDRRLIVESVGRGLNDIINMIRTTNSYDSRVLKEFIEFVELKEKDNKKGLSHYKHPNLAFIYFNPINDSQDYIETLLRIKDESGIGETREIPTYSNFILFDEIIHDFWANTTSLLKEKYYPIFIWWRLTSVIPIRPIEFIEILNKGIRYEVEENAYYILIPRRKQQPNELNESKQRVKQHELKISKEMFNIIWDYRKLAKIENEKYLFPMSVYTKFLKREDMSIKLRHYSERMSWEQMTILLDSFFDNIVTPIFNIKVVQTRDELDSINEHKTIKRFNLGDTRHISICMMMMQGFSELTIAQLAGHKNIKTQSHYASHIDDFQRSYSGLLERSMLQKMNVGDELGKFTYRQKQLLSFSKSDNSKAREISYGYCHSDNFPYECFTKECIFCNKFQIDLMKLSTTEMEDLKNKLTIIQDEIHVKLNFIKRYYSKAFKRKETHEYTNESAKKNLERNSMDLNILMNRESMIRAHLKKHQEV